MENGPQLEWLQFATGMKPLRLHLPMEHLVLPDWVFRFGWGTPGTYQFLQLRMEAAQLDTRRLQARALRKQLDTAVNSYEKVIAINPDFPEAHYNLGNTLRELGQFETAIKSYEKVIAIKPDNADVHFNLGDTLRELGQLDEAVKCYKKAISIKVDFAYAHNNLGVSLKKLGQVDEAVKCYEKAISIEVDFADAHNNLGVALQQLGQLDQAAKCYEKALAFKPDYADAYYSLSYLKKYTANDPKITKMKSLLSDSKLSRSDRINLCFALAKVNENLDNQDEFFKYLHKANRLHKQEFNYSFDKQQKFIAIIKEIFNKKPPNIEKSLSSEPSIVPLTDAADPFNNSANALLKDASEPKLDTASA